MIKVNKYYFSEAKENDKELYNELNKIVSEYLKHGEDYLGEIHAMLEKAFGEKIINFYLDDGDFDDNYVFFI